MPSGTLFVVATPLGNLQDITPRAVEALSRAALIACEDTRRTRGLLRHLGIEPARVISCHKFNERARVEQILAALRAGRDVAVVSDGGTPALSDPGAPVVAAALEEGLTVSPVPGPSALAAAVSACGFPCASFVFVGFLPAPSGRRARAIEALKEEARPMVFFEAPHRVAAAVADLAAILGDRQVTLLRELTKIHEEVRRSTLAELAASLSASEARGEFTLVVEGRREAAASDRAGAEKPSPERLRRRYEELIRGGQDPRGALKALASETGMARREIYAAVRVGPRE